MVQNLRTPTGARGLDEMLGGGFPAGCIVMVCGGSGAGKTILSFQYTAAAVRRGERCVYVNLEETMQRKKRYARLFGWDLDAAEREGFLAALDYLLLPRKEGVAEPMDKASGKLELSLEHNIIEAAKRIDAKHVIIDPLTSILVNESSSSRIRYITRQLYEAIRMLDCTALITSEGIPKSGNFYVEHFLSDGVIYMEKDLLGFQLVKTIRIAKMRGIDYDDQPRRYAIT